MFGDNPPRWLRWANTSAARATTTLIAILALIASVVVLSQLNASRDCLADQQQRLTERNRYVSIATDRERAAELALLTAPVSDTARIVELREQVATARAETDRVRAEYPAPPTRKC